MSNESLPVEEVNAEVVPFTAIGSRGQLIKDDTINKLDSEFNLCFTDKFIKDDNDIITEKTFCTVLCNLPEDFKNKYEDKVVFVNAIPIEKQKEFIECFKTNDKDIINTTLEIIMNDYSKDKIEFLNQSTTVVKDDIFDDNNAMELFNRLRRPIEPKYSDINWYDKNRSHTTKHQPDKKSKKSARRNNRRAKRNNR